MIPVLIGVAILALLVLVGRGYVTANPRDLAKRVRFLGGLGMVIGGGVLMLTGKAGFGLPLVMFGFTLLGGSGLPNFRRRGATIPPGTSRVKSPSLEMELDHASGAMTGRILAGQFAGRTLDQLDRAALFVFAREISGDRDGLALLEAYLDRRFPGWREDVQADAGARRGNTSGQGPITEEEAYQILGLDPGAGAEEIRRAHRALMKKLHPDQGGSTYLAARVNAAKDLLLRGRS